MAYVNDCSDAELAACGRVLRWLAEQPELCTAPDSQFAEIEQLAGRLLKVLRTRRRQEERGRDRELIEATDFRRGAPNLETTYAGPSDTPANLSQPRSCYVCKNKYGRLHFFYHALCRECAEENHARRNQSADLAGRYALVTGARVKIGFQVVLKLLRAGATVVATTRFPRDAALRYAREPDFAEWRERLTIYGIDLRHLGAVEHLTRHLTETLPALDVLISNAAQTIRRPPAFYRHLIEAELEGCLGLPAEVQHLLVAGPIQSLAVTATPPALLSQLHALPEDAIGDPALFPPGVYDGDRQQVDLRPLNSWKLPLGGVSTWELLEVHAVNCLAPFILLNRLEPLLLGQPARDRYVINVSAMEGKFDAFKSGSHPHTNMAKAALNMLTRTCAERYAQQRIFMNSVDTGWITNEAPFPDAQRMADEGFRPPLDNVDGAARILDPIFTGMNTGQNVFGKFLKDYRDVSW